ncbi:eukaryotic translation initiation factor 3 subunit K [Naviculisporaceae sp. PSN 640]
MDERVRRETAKTLYLTSLRMGPTWKFAYSYRVIGSSSRDGLRILSLSHANVDFTGPPLIKSLVSSGTQVITYDYAGVVPSSGSLNALLVTLQNANILDVLGFLVGGFIAQRLALSRPDVVNKLLLSGTGVSRNGGSEIPHHHAMPEVLSVEWFNRIFSALKATAGKKGQPLLAFFYTMPQLTHHIETLLTWNTNPLPHGLAQTTQKFDLAKEIPKAHLLMFPGSGHGHLFQYAEFYAEQVTSFLKR